MSAAPPPDPAALLYALQGTLAEAREDQITRVVAILDAMPVRGEADALIAPLRSRLAQIRPPRPLGFPRLLFRPLDPLIVPATEWQRGALVVPRPIIAPLAQAVCRTLHATQPALAAEIEQMIAGRTADNEAVIRRAGALLWPAAAQVLAAAPLGEDRWAASGLVVADLRPIAAGVAGILEQAVEIEAASGMVVTTISEERLRRMLTAAARRGGAALGMVAAMLLARLPGLAQLFTIIADMAGIYADTTVREAIAEALELTLDGLDADIARHEAAGMAGDIGAQASDIRRLVATAQALAEPTALPNPEQRQRHTELRGRLGAICGTRFAAALDSDFLKPLQALPAEPADLDVTRLESAARDLRRFEQAGRQSGGAELYDRMLQQAGKTVAGLSAAGGALGMVDGLRMIEILLGPDEAIALLEQQPR